MTTTTKKFDATKMVKYTPRKTRQIIDVIRGMRVDKALDQLMLMSKGAAKDIYKLVRSATTNLSIGESDYSAYKIKTIVAEEAQRLYRIMPRARGSAGRIRRRYARVRVEITSV